MHIEGIILNKTIYKERDLICNLLLRSGKRTTIYFYGGRGGGKMNKGSILEVGFMLAIELGPRKKSLETKISIAKEYKLLWRADLIRNNFKAFYLACFYLEYVSKIAIDDALDEFGNSEHDGLFNVLSNALYYLNDSLEIKNENIAFDLQKHLFIFLAKLSVQIGMTPNTDHCLFCESQLKKDDMCVFDAKDGGFICLDCNSKREEFLSDNLQLKQEYQAARILRSSLKEIANIKYKDYEQLSTIVQGTAQAKFYFINYQLGFSKDDIKTWKMISY